MINEVGGELDHNAKLHTFLKSDLGTSLPLHISLSRPISLSTGQKDEFLAKLRDSIEKGATNPFVVRPIDLAWYRSPDSNRTFLILRVSSAGKASSASTANPELMNLLKKCNTLAALYHQLPLYQQNKNESVGNAFHVSIAWTHTLPPDGAPLDAIRLFKSKKYATARSWEFQVAHIKAKIGNIVSQIALAGSERTRTVQAEAF